MTDQPTDRVADQPTEPASEPILDHSGVPVLVCDPAGPPIAGPQDVLDHLVGPAFQGAEVVAVPAGRLDGSFFDLSSGFAGEVMQKFVNYHLHLVVVGDITHHLAASKALPDLVRESNEGRHVWFVSDLVELADRLARTRGA
ncbi:DUF4180 domain-containing protein [Kitasatospora camelliae]|uniref:DUF4180 domain-containing protein n=1 Tax=Kitasatospora camelliae TaxID=3156397 RepID=A0AAU8K5C9_9ACTN